MAGQKDVLAAAMSDIRPFAALLRGVAFSDRARIDIQPAGLMITAEHGRTMLATAFVLQDVFTEYTFTPPPPSHPSDTEYPSLEISLPTLLTLLDIFGHAGALPAVGGGGQGGRGSGRGWEDGDEDGVGMGRRGRDERGKATAMRMTWGGLGRPLVLHLAGDSPDETTFTELSTFEPEEADGLELAFDNDDVAVKIIMKSTWLAEALSELDPSCTHITIMCAPPSATQDSQRRVPTFRLKASGNLGSSIMDYPDSSSVLELALFTTPAPLSFTYRHSHIAHTLPALRASTKTSLRINGEGLLSLQFMVPVRSARGRGAVENYIDFRCVAVVEDQ